MLGTGLSASIEMLQIFDATRTCSLLDVACNFAGTAGGACAALLFRREILEIAGRRKGNRGAGGPLMLACCWGGYQLYPLIPIFSRGRLRTNVAQFLATPVSLVEVCAGAAEWFAFALVMRAVAGRVKAPWLLLAMFCLPLRLLILERTLAPAELLGAGLALLWWTYPAEGSRVRAAAGVLAAAIVLRELAPFEFVAQARAMSWIPFSATLAGERLSAALVLLRKAFEYGALVWLLRASGLRYRSAGLSVAAVLMLLETAQCYLPNRQPEITDAVVAGLLACILWGSERRGTV
jgi:VanZ family protein